jgi:predicted permease
MIRQLVTEGIVLSLGGGVTGTAVAFVAVPFVKALTTVTRPALYGGDGTLLPGVERAGIDGGALMFALVAGVGTGLVFSLMPAVQLSRDAAARPARLRAALTVAELALATMLMIGAGLLVHSFGRLSEVDPGYDPSGVLTFELIVPPQFPDGRKLTLATDLELRLRSIPGVKTVGFTAGAPLSTWQEGWGLTPHGVKQDPGSGLDRRLLDVQARRVSPGYLRAIGARLVEGRWLEDRDALVQPRSLLINRTLARRYFDNGNPLGRQVDMGGNPWTVAGVVDDLRNEGLDIAPQPQAYVDQAAMRLFFRDAGWSDYPSPHMLSFAVRVSDDPLRIVGAVRGLVGQLEPAATIDGAVAMEGIVSSTLARPRLLATLPMLFAALAAILAALGIYGVMSQGVALRTREFGIRLALGAQPGRVMRMVLREAGVLTFIGIGIGVTGAVALTRYLRSLLFGVTPLDPATFVLVPLAFALIAMLASFLPSRRATLVDPMSTLRHE